MEERLMTKINLRDFYPFYNSDFFVEIPDEVETALLEAERLEKNYIRRRFYNKAYYSLDANDGIEKDILFVPLTLHEIYEQKVTSEQLQTAMVLCQTSKENGFTPTTYSVSANQILHGQRVFQRAAYPKVLSGDFAT